MKHHQTDHTIFQQPQNNPSFCSHLSVGRSLWSGADRRDGRVGVAGSQGHCGQGGGARLALFPLVCHESWQRVELFFTLPTQEHVLIVCSEGQTAKDV